MPLHMTRLRDWITIATRNLEIAVLAVTIAMSATATTAQNVLVVRMDGGGLLGPREQEIQTLADSGERVELRGVCVSACTMYLSLQNICIAPDASFGFHGPSWYGQKLPATSFEYWSRVMASHYREPLRSWFMNDWRYSIAWPHWLSGAQLIRIGYPSC